MSEKLFRRFDVCQNAAGMEMGHLEEGRLLDLVALHGDFDGFDPAVRLAPAGPWDQRGPRYCEVSWAAF